MNSFKTIEEFINQYDKEGFTINYIDLHGVAECYELEYRGKEKYLLMAIDDRTVLVDYTLTDKNYDELVEKIDIDKYEEALFHDDLLNVFKFDTLFSLYSNRTYYGNLHNTFDEVRQFKKMIEELVYYFILCNEVNKKISSDHENEYLMYNVDKLVKNPDLYNTIRTIEEYSKDGYHPSTVISMYLDKISKSGLYWYYLRKYFNAERKEDLNWLRF